MRESFRRRGDLSGDSGVYHVIGVGVARKVSAVRWNIAANIVVAWIVTLPASGLMGALCYATLRSPFTLAIASRGCCCQTWRAALDAVARCADLNLVRFWAQRGSRGVS